MVCITEFGQEGWVADQDLVCQGCGWVVKKRRPPWLLLLLAAPLIGLALLSFVGSLVVSLNEGIEQGAPAIVLGFVCAAVGISGLLLVLWPWWVIRSNPVVPGAAAPGIRFRWVEPIRRCSCGTGVACVEATQHSLKGLPAGRELRYQCGGCGRQFVIESGLRVFVNLFMGSIGLAIAAGVHALFSGALVWVFSVLLALVILGIWCVGLLRVINRLRHGKLAPHLDGNSITNRAPPS